MKRQFLSELPSFLFNNKLIVLGKFKVVDSALKPAANVFEFLARVRVGAAIELASLCFLDTLWAEKCVAVVFAVMHIPNIELNAHTDLCRLFKYAVHFVIGDRVDSCE